MLFKAKKCYFSYKVVSIIILTVGCFHNIISNIGFISNIISNSGTAFNTVH